MDDKEKNILYIGGFQLPDKNAAALRVLANAKAFRDLGYRVVFLNALTKNVGEARWTSYEGFKCYEYQRELQGKYLLSCKKVIEMIEKINVGIVIAYNNPAIALIRLRRYCKKRQIRCIADATEWYVPSGSLIYKMVKGFDSEFRMRYVHPRMDGVIAISEYLYQYYKDKVKTVKVPPLVDIQEEKWNQPVERYHEGIKIIYAGSPSAQKERLDLIVNTVEEKGKEKNIHLDILGISEEQYNMMYNCKYTGNHVSFKGRIQNIEAVRFTMEADWTVVIRENNKVVQAGFPTKVVESIACGTPVLANRFSNIEDYLNNSNSILIESCEDIVKEIIKVCENRKKDIKRDIFDYRLYLETIQEMVR